MFDKSQRLVIVAYLWSSKLLTHISHYREFTNRTERYERGLSMMNRIFELATIHGWSELETRIAFAALDEQLPIGLHNVGKLLLPSPLE